jgi:FkbM family methyltransferase
MIGSRAPGQIPLSSSVNFSSIPKSSLVGRLLRWPLALIPAGMRLPIMQGPLRGKWWIVGSGNHGYWLGSYEKPKSRQFARGIHPGDVVYDIGANVGYYTLLAALATGPAGRVIAFEPLPENLSFLRRHFALNNLPQAQVIDAAVSDHMGETFFQVAPSRSMGQLSAQGELPVQLVSLDELVAAGRIPPPDCLKIDVEGAELGVLAGAARILEQAKPDIYLATHSRDLHQACCQVLTSAGYRLEPIAGQSIEESDEIYATRR